MKRGFVIVSIIMAVSAVLVLFVNEKYSPEPARVWRLHGHAEDDIVREFGKPDSILEFPLTNGDVEFRVELIKTFPGDEPDRKNIMVRELRWAVGDYFVVVLLHRPKQKWIVFDSLKWHKSIQF